MRRRRRECPVRLLFLTRETTQRTAIPSDVLVLTATSATHCPSWQGVPKLPVSEALAGPLWLPRRRRCRHAMVGSASRAVVHLGGLPNLEGSQRERQTPPAPRRSASQAATRSGRSGVTLFVQDSFGSPVPHGAQGQRTSGGARTAGHPQSSTTRQVAESSAGLLPVLVTRQICPSGIACTPGASRPYRVTGGAPVRC